MNLNPQQLQALQAIMAQQAQAQAAKPLLEFKAGLMTKTGTTVKADPRRGTVTVNGDENGLLHLVWATRPNGQVEAANDLIVFPGDRWEKVAESKNRVYLLSLANNTRQRFFWMQEEKEAKDEEIAKELTKLIANPPEPAAAGGGFGDISGDLSESDLAQLIQSQGGAARPGRSNPAAALRNASRPSTQASGVSRASTGSTPSAPASGTAPLTGAATTAATRPAPASGHSANHMEAANILANLAQRLADQEAQARQNLASVLDPERVLPLLNEPKMLEALYQYLPETQRTPEAVRQQLRSPQFAQTLARMSAVLNSPQYGPVMASLGLPYQSDFGVGGFLKAIQDLADKEKAKNSGAPTNNDKNNPGGSGSGATGSQ